MLSGEDSLNGQTVKTKVLIEELKNDYGVKQLLLINTSGGIITRIKLFFRILHGMFCCKNFIILPAENGLRVIAPYLFLINKIFNRNLYYDVIGGWLPDFLIERPRLANILKNYSAIYVEVNSMKVSLEKQGFNNVIVIPNCKKLNIIDQNEAPPSIMDGKIKFATFSRVMKAKGIEDAANAIRKANTIRGKEIFHLDVYGFIEISEARWFDELQKEYSAEMSYKGAIPFEKSTDVLKNYYGLLFPTYYSGEGFAGSIIDAYAAGLPVIASDWKYNTEIVEAGKDGIIVPLQDSHKLAEAILWSESNAPEWEQFRNNVIKKAHLYLPSEALSVLKRNLA